MRTAELVAEPHGLTVQPHVGLREVDTGAWTALDRTQVSAVPEWESMLETSGYDRACTDAGRRDRGRGAARALGAIDEIVERHEGQSVVVISHHLVVESILAKAMGIPVEELWLPKRGGNCFLSRLDAADGLLAPTMVYDGSHMGELAGLDGAKSAHRDEG